MKKLLGVIIYTSFHIAFFVSSIEIYSQEDNHSHNLGKEVFIELSALDNISKSISIEFEIPMPSGMMEIAMLERIYLSPNQDENIKTFTGKTTVSNSPLKVTYSKIGFTAAIHYKGGYYFIEKGDSKKDGIYRLFSLNEVNKGICEVNHSIQIDTKSIKAAAKSVIPFPVGSEMRTYRMAAAATGEMTVLYGSQANTSAQIVAIMNAANLIYEVEAAVTFSLITKTTNSPYQILFTNGATDPFNTSNGSSATNAQIGFTSMHPATLNYSEYDIGHVFHSYGGGCCSASGQAGPTPCSDTEKSRAWTQFTHGSSVAFVTGLFVHEVGHQFSAWHTFNGNSGLCVTQWSSTAAVEPGSGSTLMAYGNNCSSPTNYVLTAPNDENYFHTKSLDQIYTTVAGDGGCITTGSTGNNVPSANANTDITIPKGTPFTLLGSATDADGTGSLTYVWDQFDNATSQDKGALGSSINGVGGYSAVNSAANAPLFRSKMSNSPSRTFPSLDFILNNANNPADNEGEDLPQVSRGMTFRFTVRDNEAGGGGVDSDEVEVTVDGTKGPLEITSQGTTSTLEVGMTYPVTWTVNSTNTISPNVKISLSTDNGATFPIVLLASTPNDGIQNVTIPSVPSSTTARIKVSSTHHATHDFFDINNASLIAGSCATYASADTPKALSDPGSITSTITVADVGTIEDVNVVNLNGTHTWINDLSFTLRHPDGTTLNIIDQRCSNQDDFNVTLDDDGTSIINICPYNNGGTFKPDNALSVFNGKPSNGNWILTVTDNFGGDGGNLNGWSLAICRAAPPCSITGASAGAVSCSGNNAIFNMSFTIANGSGNYQVVNASNTVVGSGASSPIAVTVTGPTSAGNQNFRVRDAAEISCISSAIAVNIPQCPPPCSITGVTAGAAICSGQDASFSITAFTPSNGSGSYEVVNTSNQVVGSGNAAAIVCTELGPTSAGNQDFRVRDAANNTCISNAVTVAISTCILPCNSVSGSNIGGTVSSDSMLSKTYLTSNADVSSGNVKFQAPDSVVLRANFQVSTSGIFEVQIGDCEEVP